MTLYFVTSLLAKTAAQQQDICTDRPNSAVSSLSMLQRSMQKNKDVLGHAYNLVADLSPHDAAADPASLREASHGAQQGSYLISALPAGEFEQPGGSMAPDSAVRLAVHGTNGLYSSRNVSQVNAGNWNPPNFAFALANSMKDALLALQQYIAALGPGTSLAQGTPAAIHSQPATASNPSGVYFRPVSVTLRCVLALTFLFLATYTALAIARNMDELSGRVRPSLITETLTVASRCTTYAPMMAALFLACRMYALQSTAGLGDPQVWAKTCMKVATIGMFAEPLMVCILPLLVKHDLAAGKPFEKLSGVACKLDVHPQLFRYGQQYDEAYSYAWMAQMMLLLPIYGGVGGVIVAIFVYPVKHAVSPAVSATVILAGWYFAIHGLVFIARTRQQMSSSSSSAKQGPWHHQAEPESPALTRNTSTSSLVSISLADADPKEEVEIGDDRFVKFALNASYPMDTAAMFAVLFLGARMRAVQLGREPEVWTQVCCAACALALPFLSLLNGIAGINSSERLGYYGEKLYEADGKKLLIGKHLVAAALYTNVILVMVSIRSLHAASAPSPLSTTIESLLQFSYQYLIVHGLHWLFAATRTFVFKRDWALIMETSLLAARSSVQTAPILAILFVSCRLRALQITSHKGDPQGWAQHTMDIIRAANFIQVVCCLTLPIFTGIATKTDGEGSAEYDLQPLVGAYIVTCMKYFALFLIFGGVSVVGISMFMITPETARSDNVIFSSMVGMISFFCVFILVLLIVMVLSSAKLVGLSIKLAIESVDRTLLGVDVDVGIARLDICRGFVNLADIIVHNPEGYKTPYLLSVKKIVVKLNMVDLIKSFGKRVEIEALILNNVDIIFEKNSSTSNVQDILNHLSGPQSGDKGEQVPKSKGDYVEQKTIEEKATSSNQDQERKVILHRIDILDVGAKIASTYFGGSGVRVALGNVSYEDFQKDSGGNVQVSEVITIILETLMKTALANTKVVGEAVEQTVTQTAHKASQAAKWVLNQGRSGFNALLENVSGV